MVRGWLVLLLVALWAPPAHAQLGGASFGSSDWSSGSSSDSSSSSSYESSSEYSSSSWSADSWSSSGSTDTSSSYDYGSGSDYDGSLGTEVWAIVIGTAVLTTSPVWIMLLMVGWRRFGPKPRIHINVYSVAVDGSRRRAIQRSFENLARVHGPSRPTGRRNLLAAATQRLVEAKSGWAYVGGRVAARPLESVAQTHFQRAVSELRSRYRTETVRGVDGQVKVRRLHAEPEAKPEEGEGFCVVSVVVAARRALPEPEPTRRSLIQALEWFGRIRPKDLVAFEVIWSPSEELDRMSSLELQTLYPELKRLEGAVAGIQHCGHCGAVYAREIGRCPSCSAPAAA